MIGPIIESWGTPFDGDNECDVLLDAITLGDLFDRNFWKNRKLRFQ